MGDSSFFTKQKLASAVTSGYLALRQMGGSKPNSTFAAVQHTTHRPTPPANKSYYNKTSSTPTPDIQSQINSLTFNGTSDFTRLNNLLRTAPSGVISTTNESLRTYYNGLLPSLSIPTGTTFYLLAGTNINANVLSSLQANSYIIMPDSHNITIDGKTVSVTNRKVVVNNVQYNSGDPIRITNNVPTLDFLIAGSPALLQMATNYNLDVSPFPTTNFNNITKYFVLDTDDTRNSSNDSYWGATLQKPNYPNSSTDPQFTSNITCDGLVSFAFTPTNENELNDQAFISILLGTKDLPLIDPNTQVRELSRILYVDFIDSNGLRISGDFPCAVDDIDGIYHWGSFISLGTQQLPISGQLIIGQKYYLVIKYRVPTTLFLMNMMTLT